MPQKVTVIFELLDHVSNKSKRLEQNIQNLQRLQKKWGVSTKDMNRAMANMGIHLDKSGHFVDMMGNRVQMTTRQINALGVQSQKTGRAFKFEYLSILFGAMLLQRTFQQLRDVSVQSFMKITEGQTAAGRAMNTLTAHVELLKFSIGNAIGQALMPLLPLLIDIINRVSDWIQRNPRLVGTIIALGGAIAGAVFWFASMKLLMSGIKLHRFGAQVGRITTALGPLALKIGIVIAAIYILYKAWQTNFLGIRQIVGSFIVWLSDALANPFVNKFVKVLGMGLITLFNLFKFTFENLESIIKLSWVGIQLATADAWNFILTVVREAVNGVIYFVNTLIDGINAVTGIGIPKMKRVGDALNEWMVDTSRLRGEAVKLSHILSRDFAQAMDENTLMVQNFLKGFDEAIPLMRAFGQELIKQGEEMDALKEAGLAPEFGESIVSDLQTLLKNLGIPMFQHGGTMPHTGLAMLHAGERVIPRGGDINVGGVSITVEGGGVDAEALAEIIGEQIGLGIRSRTAIGANKFL